MMTRHLPGALIAAALVAASLSGCTGGTTVAEGGIGGSGYTSGSVSGFGSIFVNGVEFETDGSTFTGDARSEADLEVGMVVEVEGTVNADGITGRAHTIRYRRLLHGTVDVGGNTIAIDGGLTVLGQRVVTDSQTVFEPGASGYLLLAEIGEGDVLDIDGFLRTDGIHATRVAVAAPDFVPGDALELRGIIDELDEDSFRIGGLNVIYSAPALGEGDLADGALVRVIAASPPASGEALQATLVEVEAKASGSAGEPVELEGVVSQSGGNRFVNGHPLQFHAGTEFPAGLDETALVDGTRVEVSGAWADDGSTVRVDQVELESEGDYEIDAPVARVSDSGDRVTVLGVDVLLTTKTIFQDERENSTDRFGYGDLIAGDYASLHFAGSDGAWVATLVEVDDPDPLPANVEVVGPAVVAGGVLTVLGVRIDGLDAEDLAGTGYGSVEQFIADVDGQVIEVDGTWDGLTFTATDVELEN